MENRGAHDCPYHRQLGGEWMGHRVRDHGYFTPGCATTQHLLRTLGLKHQRHEDCPDRVRVQGSPPVDSATVLLGITAGWGGAEGSLAGGRNGKDAFIDGYD